MSYVRALSGAAVWSRPGAIATPAKDPPCRPHRWRMQNRDENSSRSGNAVMRPCPVPGRASDDPSCHRRSNLHQPAAAACESVPSIARTRPPRSKRSRCRAALASLCGAEQRPPSPACPGWPRSRGGRRFASSWKSTSNSRRPHRRLSPPARRRAAFDQPFLKDLLLSPVVRIGVLDRGRASTSLRAVRMSAAMRTGTSKKI